MKRKFLILLSIMFIIIIIGAAVSNITSIGSKNTTDKTTIVTSFNPIYVATSNIVSDIEGVELINLAENQTGCLHDYQLTTKDMKKLENADIFIINGGGIEDFVQDIIASYPDIKVIDSSTGIDFLVSEEGHNHEHEKEEETGEFNPHIWVDPSNYIKQIQNIRNGLVEYNNKNAIKYKQNATQYEKKIESLNRELIATIKEPENKDIVIFHESFAYLAQKLDLNVVHSVDIESDTSLGAGEIAEVIDEVNSNKIKVLITEEQYSTDVPSNIAKETGANMYIIDSLVTSDGKKDSYITGMKKNIGVLKEALYNK